MEYGGLGFDYKWDLGWMNDTLDYFKKTSEERRENLGKLTFSMMYAWNEHYILPFSHDENVHGKATIVQKMYGDYEGKFPQARALYLYMAIHPGKMILWATNLRSCVNLMKAASRTGWCCSTPTTTISTATAKR